MRPLSNDSRIPQATYKIQVKYQFWEVKFIMPLYSLHQVVYMIERDLKVLKPESQDTKSYKKCPVWTVHHWICPSRRKKWTGRGKLWPRARWWSSDTKLTVYPVIHKSNASNVTNVYAIYKRAKYGLDFGWQLVS